MNIRIDWREVACYVAMALIAVLMIALYTGTPECATEDSTLCVWNAASRGNGAGQSFLAITDTYRIYLD